jgi:hypothetical protein
MTASMSKNPRYGHVLLIVSASMKSIPEAFLIGNFLIISCNYCSMNGVLCFQWWLHALSYPFCSGVSPERTPSCVRLFKRVTAVCFHVVVCELCNFMLARTLSSHNFLVCILYIIPHGLS